MVVIKKMPDYVITLKQRTTEKKINRKYSFLKNKIDVSEHFSQKVSGENLFADFICHQRQPCHLCVPPCIMKSKQILSKELSKISVYNAITLKSAKIPLENSAYPHPT